MNLVAAVYLVAGVVAALRWGGWDTRQHYAIAGPTAAGRFLGVALVAALIVLLWPLYWRARQHDAARSHLLNRHDAEPLPKVVAEPDRRRQQQG